MIIKKKTFYNKLDQLPVYITDTSSNSDNYLRLSDVPTELTAGKNSFKILGNSAIFKKNTPIYIEILDSSRNLVYNEIPRYIDKSKRRIVSINVDESVVSGPGLITICGILNDNLVPPQFRDQVNFKWQKQINIEPFKSNVFEILYDTPPVVELNTLIRPFISKSYRNSEQTIVYEYGKYNYTDSNFNEYIGDKDNSVNIFQNYDSNKLLVSYTEYPSITSFNKNNLFALRYENYTAKSKIKNNPYIIGKSVDFNSDMVGGLVSIYDTIDYTPNILTGNTILLSGVEQAPSASYFSYIDFLLNNKYAGMLSPYKVSVSDVNSITNYGTFFTKDILIKKFTPNTLTGSFSQRVRSDYTASMVSLNREDGYIYHYNSVLPFRVTSTSSLNNIVSNYIIAEIDISNLEPISGEVSKIRISAKPKTDSGDFTDLGTFTTLGTEVLTDNNYINHVQYVDSNYRLLGYFKPVISDAYETSIIESSSFRENNADFSDITLWNSSSFFGWATSSAYAPYMTASQFRVELSGSSNQYINFTKYKLDVNPSNVASRHYLVYIGEPVPKLTSSLYDTTFQVGVRLHGRDTGSLNGTLSPIRIKPAIFKSSSAHYPSSSFEEFPYSKDPNWLDDSEYGPNASSSYLDYFTDLGWVTRNILVPSGTENLYMGVIIDSPTQDINDVGQSVTISKIVGREIGDTTRIINQYWTASLINPTYYISASAITNSISPRITSDYKSLMDSVEISSNYVGPSSDYTTVTGKDTTLFHTNNWFKFYKDTTYLLRFNASCQRLMSVQERGRNIVSNGNFDQAFVAFNQLGYYDWFGNYGGAPAASSSSPALLSDADGTMRISYVSGAMVSYQLYGNLQFPPYGSAPGAFTILYDDTRLVRGGRYIIRYDIVENTSPSTAGVRVFLRDSGAGPWDVYNSAVGSYEFVVDSYAATTSRRILVQYDFNRVSVNDPSAVLAIDNLEVIHQELTDGPVPLESSLKAWAINSSSSNTFNIKPFYDLGIPERGEFIGELKHRYETQTFNDGFNEIKYFTDVEMEFTATETGYGKLGFELDSLSKWNLSEISIKPKDRVGLTPNYTKIFLKIPTTMFTLPDYGDVIWSGNAGGYADGTIDITTSPLTFKIEYLNDFDTKSNYVTVLNDIQFTNVDKQKSNTKTSVINDIGTTRTYY